jgi:hypothetical protein
MIRRRDEFRASQICCSRTDASDHRANQLEQMVWAPAEGALAAESAEGYLDASPLDACEVS